MPDLGSMNKDTLSALAKQLHDQSCAVFAEKFNNVCVIDYIY